MIEHSSATFEPTGVDGIFGLASPVTSSWGAQSPLIEWLQQNNFYKAFAMCLKSEGGSMVLGVNDHSNPDVAFTPTVVNKGQIIYYPVNLTDFKVGGTSLGISSDNLNSQYGALVDSGTTLMLFPDVVFAALKTSFQNLCSSYQLPGICGASQGQSLFDGTCVPMTDQDRSNFPTLSFNVDQVSIDLPVTPATYLISQTGTGADDVTWCLGIQSSPAGQGVTILGDTFMRGLYVVFDQESGSVGFGNQTLCP